MVKKLSYQTPSVRVKGVSTERFFLASATFGDIAPGSDLGTGGSWEFGEDD